MRRFALALAASIVACTTIEVIPPGEDAGDGVVDAASDAPSPGVDAGLVCPGALAPACTLDGRGCGDAGVTYRCYTGGPLCPTGDVGSCTLLGADLQAARYADLCCERAACTRTFALGCDLDGASDAGRGAGWSCPNKPGIGKPPGNCTRRAAPLPDSPAVEYCCGP